ncbi:hypothetical protein ACFVWG_18610 [Kribbella sp. NPDC058245]|uniref:hypothetical protein n=1 Tax=Kribbella sp. NPDC058245 TaxID=3346399 RepID=UPI0036E5396E
MPSSSTDGSWLERLVMATPAGRWSTLQLVWSLIWIVGMSGLSMAFAYDDLALNDRAETVPALVIRTNYDQQGESFNAELGAPYQGVRVLVEDIHQRPAAGDVLMLEVDPQKPARVRDPQAAGWRLRDFAFIALLPVGLVIGWAHGRRRLRARA